MGRSVQNVRLARFSLVMLLAIVAAALLVSLGLNATSAQAQVATGGGGNDKNVYVVAGQVSPQTYGMYLVDYEKQTICVYQFLPKSRKLRLMAARTYAYDVQLDEFNTDAPKPREVKKLVKLHKRLGADK